MAITTIFYTSDAEDCIEVQWDNGRAMTFKYPVGSGVPADVIAWLDSNTPAATPQPTAAEQALIELNQRDDAGTDMRVLEDLVDVLIDNSVIAMADLPQAAQDKIEARKEARAKLSSSSSSAS